jgi:hypothetical protein
MGTMPALTRTGRERRRQLFGALVALTLLAAAPADALPFLYAWDADAISPRTTQPGFISVSQCTLLPGDPTNVCGGSSESQSEPPPVLGYLPPWTPTGDFQATPQPGAPGFEALWEDAHTIVGMIEAQLRIEGIPVGSYELWLLSHGPDGESTIFQVNGEDVGTVNWASDNYWSTQVLKVPITVDATGIINVGYQAGFLSGLGVLNGIVIVPEPSTILLVMGGLAAIARVRRRASPSA